MTDTAPAAGGQGDGVAAGAGQTPAAAPPIAWLPEADETTVGYVQNKGWDNPAKAIDSYRNLEKLMGAEKAGNTVVIPRSDADPKEWAAVYDRLGRPSDPAGYKVETPEGGDADFQGKVFGKMHELGLTKAQGEALASWYNEQVQGASAAAKEAAEVRFATEQAELKTEWGAAYTQNLAAAQTAARGLGLEPETIDRLAETLGHKATMALLHKIGSRMGEDSFVTGDTRGGFGTAMTPAQAKAEIQALQADRDFVNKYIGGDKAARDKMMSLHAFAYPEG